MLKNKEILFALLGVVAIVVIGGIAAWFIIGGNNNNETNETDGRINFSIINGTVEVDNLQAGAAVPGAAVSIQNLSTGDALIRVKLEQNGFYRRNDTATNVFAITGDLMNEDKWVYRNGWFYHIGPVESSVESLLIISGVSVLNNVPQEYRGRTTGFSVTIDQIHADQEAVELLWIGSGTGTITRAEATGILRLF